MVDFFKDQSDQWWLELLTPLYSRLDVKLDMDVVKAVRRACEYHVPGSSVFLTVTEISNHTGVPWYKLFIFFAYALGKLEPPSKSLFNSQPPEQKQPS